MADLWRHPDLKRAAIWLDNPPSVEAMDNAELWNEFGFHNHCLDIIRRAELPENETPGSRGARRLLRLGGIALAIAGFPLTFAHPLVGLAGEFFGAALVILGEVHGWRERAKAREREEVAKPILTRRNAVYSELRFRAAQATPP